jgi:myo-inositol 2-dehydrogenase/D-chiro-inositol 1-dehydrogenase
MHAFVSSCCGDQPLPLALADVTEATRVGLAITRSLHTGQPQAV